MVKDARVTLRRRHSYATVSNKIRKVKTPGGRLLAHYTTKTVNAPICGDCKSELNGLPCIHGRDYARLTRSQRTVARAYGGSRCHACVRSRIMRAFIIEEQKIVKKTVAEKLSKAKKESK